MFVEKKKGGTLDDRRNRIDGGHNMGPTKILLSSKKSGEPPASKFFPNFGARGSPDFFNKKSVKNFGLSHIMSFFVALCRGQFLGPRVFFSKF